MFEVFSKTSFRIWKHSLSLFLSGSLALIHRKVINCVLIELFRVSQCTVTMAISDCLVKSSPSQKAKSIINKSKHTRSARISLARGHVQFLRRTPARCSASVCKPSLTNQQVPHESHMTHSLQTKTLSVYPLPFAVKLFLPCTVCVCVEM